MKPVAFDYARPRSVEAAVALLAERPEAKVLAGGQTLGPMLNLRLVQPELLIDITRIAELVRATEDDGLSIGACVSHAAIEDGRVGDVTDGFLPRVAHGIAYRAVRTRGTVGGSLAHADPAADWLSALLALGAELEIAGPEGRRRVALRDFVRGAMETDLAAAEIIVAIRVPRPNKGSRFGFHKICRKTGEFAEAIGVAAIDAGGGFLMAVGGGSGRPILLDDPARLLKDADPLSPQGVDLDLAMAALRDAGLGGDDYELQIHAVAMRRALQQAAGA